MRRPALTTDRSTPSFGSSSLLVPYQNICHIMTAPPRKFAP